MLLLKKMVETKELQDHIREEDARAEQIGSAGIRLFEVLYGGKQQDS